MKKRHAAIIQIDYKLLPHFLDFDGATIHRVYTPDNLWKPDVFRVVIEHPDLPEVKENEELQVVLPILEATYGENGVITKIKRVDPPKQNSGKI